MRALVMAMGLMVATPALAILVARRLQAFPAPRANSFFLRVPLVAAAIIALWVASGDTAEANSERRAAELVHRHTQDRSRPVWFEGHWGFQYYMQEFGAQPLRLGPAIYRAGDFLAIPTNNLAPFQIPENVLGTPILVGSTQGSMLTTQNRELGAGFYASTLGPLPFAFGPAPPDRAVVAQIIKSFKLDPQGIGRKQTRSKRH